MRISSLPFPFSPVRLSAGEEEDVICAECVRRYLSDLVKSVEY